MSRHEVRPTCSPPVQEKVHVHLNLSGKSLFWLMPLGRRALERRLEAMLATAFSGEVELDLLLVRDGEMAAYNQTYMGCHGPTNILSFPLEEQPCDSAEVTNLGSLVLSVDMLHREARLYGQNLETHCLRLIAHGLGHLAGFDHGPEMDAFCMAMEESACSGSSERA